MNSIDSIVAIATSESPKIDTVSFLMHSMHAVLMLSFVTKSIFSRLVKDSEDVNIILQISPNDGFTIKEKLKRALSEAVITEGAYRYSTSVTLRKHAHVIYIFFFRCKTRKCSVENV